MSDHGLCQLLFYDHECCHEACGTIIIVLTAVGLGTLYAFAGVSDHRRGHQIYSVNRSDTSTGQLWRQFSVYRRMIVFGIIQGLYIMQFDGRAQKKGTEAKKEAAHNGKAQKQKAASARKK